MELDEIFRRLEKKTENDLLQQATRMAHKAQSNAYAKLDNPSFLKKKQIATEVLWFFVSLVIGFLAGCVFYEIFSIWIPEAKNELVSNLLQSNANFLYFLSAICFVGVYITRLTIWALTLLR